MLIQQLMGTILIKENEMMTVQMVAFHHYQQTNPPLFTDATTRNIYITPGIFLSVRYHINIIND